MKKDLYEKGIVIIDSAFLLMCPYIVYSICPLKVDVTAMKLNY